MVLAASKLLAVDYHARVRARLLTAIAAAIFWTCPAYCRQDAQTKPEAPKSEPQYDDTFSGPIVELSAEKLTVSRTILGKPERHTFWIRQDTRVEGKLKLKAKVTVGFSTSEDGDVARLIVVRPTKK